MGHFLQQITARNLLSFGPEGMTVGLEPLNVLIGPNGSGKSNLLDVISLLQAAPRELARPVREGGGARNWIWQGNPRMPASVAALAESPDESRWGRIRHTIAFTEAGRRFSLVDERVENELPSPGADDVYFSTATKTAIRRLMSAMKPARGGSSGMILRTMSRCCRS